MNYWHYSVACFQITAIIGEYENAHFFRYQIFSSISIHEVELKIIYNVEIEKRNFFIKHL